MPTTVQYRTAPVAWDFQTKTRDSKLDRLIAIASDPDLLVVALICLAGLLIAACLVQFLPLQSDAAAYLAQAS